MMIIVVLRWYLMLIGKFHALPEGYFFLAVVARHFDLLKNQAEPIYAVRNKFVLL